MYLKHRIMDWLRLKKKLCKIFNSQLKQVAYDLILEYLEGW